MTTLAERQSGSSQVPTVETPRTAAGHTRVTAGRGYPRDASTRLVAYRGRHDDQAAAYARVPARVERGAPELMDSFR